jgi:hypothetical protein
MGMVRICDQTALTFGADRKCPTASRPVVDICRDAQFVVVLPCTSRHHTNNSLFYELTPKKVFWNRVPQKQSFAFYRYENVTANRLHAKIGMMDQSARIDLMAWLKGFY